MKDNEGSAWVRRDNSIWLADDNGRSLYEVNASTGVLKRTIGHRELEAVRRFRGRARAGASRIRDLESLAYDAANDRLYAFSGSCCKRPVRPTVFRLTRQSDRLQLETYQPLRRGSPTTASAVNSRNKRIYVGSGRIIRAYSYTRHSFGKPIRVPNLTDILGMDFSADGTDLFVARSGRTLSRVNWGKKALVPGWTFNLAPFRVRDARAVAAVRGRLFVSDGYDKRPRGAPLRYAIFVFKRG